MKLTYIYHSCFALETTDYSVLFDYFRDTNGKTGYVHDVLLSRPEPLYVLSSHFHPDHFSREVLEWKSRKENITYLLSRDILKHKRAAAGEALFLRKGELFEDAHLYVRAFGSTDVGVSFLLRVEGKTIFHAGDLNNWHRKDEATEREVRMAEGNFLHELKYLKESCPRLHVAMFPIDPRIGSDFARGAEQLVDRLAVEIFVPMHFWERVDEAASFGPYAEERGVRFALLSRAGESIEV
ncbi:hydrolase [Parabacteroides sp. An277]|uniref:MBL fold metallo-hydrolase n=1 Tax=Parabacteroides sp. An277 TaxID=1965619 RepID=UPI000B38F2D5|nr:MBL fold metallo-hydrolase [Parabacteroides sp. An277]OUO49621.1 hydrolase [Parabacteroides sp. An277]